jgi:hypothetical protein
MVSVAASSIGMAWHGAWSMHASVRPAVRRRQSAVPLPPNRQARINAGEARHATCMVEDPHYLYDRHGWIERPN